MTTLVPARLFVGSTWLYPARFRSTARCSSISRRRETSLTKYLVTDKELFQLVADKFDMRHSSLQQIGSTKGSRIPLRNLGPALRGGMNDLEPFRVEITILSVCFQFL